MNESRVGEGVERGGGPLAATAALPAIAAIGLRARSGWATLVAVGWEPSGALAPGERRSSGKALPAVIERRRIELADAAAGSHQPYHLAAAAASAAGAEGSARRGMAAGEAALAAAEKVVEACRRRSRQLAIEALEGAVGELRRRGWAVAGCGIVLGSGRREETLAVTLASHARIHGAEGELFRQALVAASAGLGLAVTGIGEKDLQRRGAADLHLAPAELERRVQALGRGLGPPWRQDEKLAALAAWIALAGATA